MWADAVADLADPADRDLRREAAGGLADAAVAAARWRGGSVPFPGLPERVRLGRRAPRRPRPARATTATRPRSGRTASSRSRSGSTSQRPAIRSARPAGSACRRSGAVQQVLHRVVRRVADVRLGVDHQPRLPPGRQHVARVQVGEQQHLALGGARQAAPQLETGPGNAGVEAAPRVLLVLLRPLLAHLRAAAGTRARPAAAPRAAAAARRPRRPAPPRATTGRARCRAGRVRAAARTCPRRRGRRAPGRCRRPAHSRSPAASCWDSALVQPALSTRSRPAASRAGATQAV